MSKITLDSVASGYDLSKINSNFQTIQNELNDKVLYRNNPVGEANTLITTIDCNDKSLYNLPEPTLSHQAATKNYVDTAPTTSADAAAVSAAAAAVSETNAAVSAASAAASAIEVEDQKIVWLGAWSGATAYAVNDAVSVSGSSYICILANTNQTPPNATYWGVLASKGAAGAGTGDMLAANNLSDIANAATARTNLGVQIGANVQAYDADIPTVAASQAEMETGTEAALRSMSPLRVAQAVQALSDFSRIVQVVEATPVTAIMTCSTVLPADDSVPQNTEGDEVITVEITPTSSANRLRIEVDAPFVAPTSNATCAGALFQGTTASALAVCSFAQTGLNYPTGIRLVYEMEAGTTSATTFKFRAGAGSGSLYINSTSSGRLYGGVSAVRMRVTEIKV